MLSRRSLLIGGGAGIGLVVAWAGWPRRYAPNLATAPGQVAFGAYLKIANDGIVTVAVPQTEHGQGVYTTLPQIAADELGADWRTVGVEAAPVNPLYANPLAAEALFGDVLPPAVRREEAKRAAMMLTAGSTSIRMFEAPLRQAAAAARVLLCKAAAARWQVDWQQCAVASGFVTHGKDRLRFADLAETAATEALPNAIPLRADRENRLVGQSLPRLDAPAKVDGSANFAGDIRLPDMAFASLCEGPAGRARLVSCDTAAADRVPGVTQVVQTDHWVAAIGTTWWAADRGVRALAPRFEGSGIDGAAIARALDAALATGGDRVAKRGDVAAAFRGEQAFAATYQVAPSVHAAIETPAATAHWHGDRLELWIASDAPAQARAAAADAIGVAVADVTVHPMLVGGSFGAALEHDLAARAAVLAVRLKRPVQVTRSRAEAQRRDAVRAPATARMTARLGTGGAVQAWQARIAIPATGRALAARVMPGDLVTGTALAVSGGGDAAAVDGAVPPYGIPNLAIDHHVAALPIETGYLRGGASGYTAFFTECFIDELARAVAMEPLSFRIAMLGGNARLARCLSTAAALGGWDGGVPGSGQGIACHAFRGSYVAVLAEAHVDAGQVEVDRLVAAVDCGRQINPDIVRQQVEGGLVFGMAAALGAAATYRQGIVGGDLHLPRLADTPDITVELVESDEAPGGVGEIGIPAVAPAIANAVHSATGLRLRALPLRPAA